MFSGGEKMTGDRLLLSFCVIIALITGTSCFSGFSFDAAPTDVIAERHQTLFWDCHAQGEGPVSYTWYQDGALINDSTREVLENGTLVIPDVLYRRDSGAYRCCASGGLGVLCSALVKLSIATLPQFSVNPESTNVTEGSTARLTCYTEGNPSPVIIWKKDRRMIDMSGTTNQRYNMLPGGILQIDDVRPVDAGEYKCQASNIFRSRNSSPAILGILPPFQGQIPQVPEIVAGPQNLETIVGDYAVFECLASHPDYVIKWSRLGNVPLRQEGVVYIGRNNLFLDHVTLADSGVYVCTVTNSESALSVFSQARLSVHAPPQISRSLLQDRLDLSVGLIARFPCRVTGTPVPQVTWLHEGRVIEERDGTSVQDNNDLVINWVQPEDTGIYQCEAVNVAGRDIASALLQPSEVANAPSPPKNLRVTYTTSTTITLVWDPAEVNPDLVSFALHYQITGGRESSIPLNYFMTSKVLDRLVPFTQYEIYALYWTTTTSSAPSNTVIATTQEDVPALAPDFSVSSSSQTSISVFWEELKGPARNGIITEYIIEYKKVQTSDFFEAQTVQITVPGDETSHVLEGLELDTQYKLRMAAATSVGAGHYSSWVKVKTMDNSLDISLPPPTVGVRALNDTTIEISVSPVPNTANLLGLKVEILNEEGANVRSLRIPLSKLVFAVGGLSPSTTYEVHVQAYNTDVDGLTAIGTVATHDQPMCTNSFPPEFSVTSSTPRSILVTWQKSPTDGSLQSYTIQYTADLPNATAQTVSYETRREEQQPYQLRIGRLEPYTVYQVEMRADVPNCSGRFGISFSIRTLQDLPSPVAEVLAEPQDPFSIRLMWRSPREPNGVITHYVITYNDDLRSPAEAWTRVQQNASQEYSTVGNLKSNTAYYFKVQASTKVGVGPPSNPPVMAKTPQEITTVATDQQMGILIGVILALMCIVICCTILLIRFKSPARGSHLSVVSAKDQLAHGGGYLCDGRCRMSDRASYPDGIYLDDLETVRPMLSDQHPVMSPQGIIYQDGTYAENPTLQPEADLSNHSSSSGFADSSRTGGTPHGSPNPGGDSHLRELPSPPGKIPSSHRLRSSSQEQDPGIADHRAGQSAEGVEEPMADCRGAMASHVRYMDPELVGRSRGRHNNEVPLLDRMLRSTAPGETQV